MIHKIWRVTKRILWGILGMFAGLTGLLCLFAAALTVFPGLGNLNSNLEAIKHQLDMVVFVLRCLEFFVIAGFIYSVIFQGDNLWYWVKYSSKTDPIYRIGVFVLALSAGIALLALILNGIFS